MRTGKGNGLILLGLLMMLGAGGLAIRNEYDDNRAQQSAEAVLEQLRGEWTDRETLQEETEPPADCSRKPAGEMPIEMIDGRPYIGVLAIPALDLELPVIGIWNDSDLRRAPCRYSGSAYSDDLVIAAHNYRSHFGNLKNLRAGDRIILTDMAGNVFTYEVSVLETLQPTAVEEMTSGRWPLSLFTCTAGGKLRVTVRCGLVGEKYS